MVRTRSAQNLVKEQEIEGNDSGSEVEDNVEPVEESDLNSEEELILPNHNPQSCYMTKTGRTYLKNPP